MNPFEVISGLQIGELSTLIVYIDIFPQFSSNGNKLTSVPLKYKLFLKQIYFTQKWNSNSS